MMNICIQHICRHVFTHVRVGKAKGGTRLTLVGCLEVSFLFHCKSGWTLLGFPCCQRLHHGLHPWLLVFPIFSLDFSVVANNNEHMGAK